MILSADDFGISPAVDEGILMLIEKNRISSTSCMVTGLDSALTRNLILLKKYNTKVDVGLHLVLTESTPLSGAAFKSGFVDRNGSFYSLKNLIARAYFGKLNQACLDAEIRAQIESFINIFGHAPDFIDGHQHVQQLPIVRNSIIAAMKHFKSLRYVRIADLPNQWILNSAQSVSFRFALENLALAIPGRRAAALFTKNNIQHNRFLLGYYRHTANVQFKTVFKNYLTLKPQAHDVFFCHPGFVDEHLKKVDTLVDSRKDNLDFLLSAEFEDMCNINKISINRFVNFA